LKSPIRARDHAKLLTEIEEIEKESNRRPAHNQEGHRMLRRGHSHPSGQPIGADKVAQKSMRKKQTAN
jgi:hypothetical protein